MTSAQIMQAASQHGRRFGRGPREDVELQSAAPIAAGYYNDYERQLAIAASRRMQAGEQLPEPVQALARSFDAVDPDAPRRQLASMLEAAQLAEGQARRNAARAATPVDWTASDAKLLQQQLAGDNGFVRDFLTEMSGYTPEQRVATNANLRSGQAAWQPRPYRPLLPSESDLKGNRPMADRNLLLNPRFKKLLAENPQEAKTVYNRLTYNEFGLGRDLESDLKQSMDYQQSAFAISANQRMQEAEKQKSLEERRQWMDETSKKELENQLKGAITKGYLEGDWWLDPQADRIMQRVPVRTLDETTGRETTVMQIQPAPKFFDQKAREYHPDYQDPYSQWPMPDREGEDAWKQLEAQTPSGEFASIVPLLDAEIRRVESMTGKTLAPRQKLMLRNLFIMEKLKGQKTTPMQRQQMLNEMQGRKISDAWEAIFGPKTPTVDESKMWNPYEGSGFMGPSI